MFYTMYDLYKHIGMTKVKFTVKILVVNGQSSHYSKNAFGLVFICKLLHCTEAKQIILALIN